MTHREKFKETEKKDEYLDLTMELKNLRNMKVTFIPTMIGSLSTVNKGLVQGLEELEIKGGVETILTTALMRLAKMLRVPVKD